MLVSLDLMVQLEAIWNTPKPRIMIFITFYYKFYLSFACGMTANNLKNSEMPITV
jgi:hypothetical protein